ncbi:MAG TPA: SdiA-regulated domain-containing protein [Flavitalea sp.]|nr:SdiA-regulated domain-containing protein [Flavitalea sp.]
MSKTIKYHILLNSIIVFLLIEEVSGNILQAPQQDHTAFGVDTILPRRIKDVVKITRFWKLPPLLKNISAIDFISRGKLACLQDEVGSIFILNLGTDKIENEIVFGPPGDYEGLVLIKNNAYVACGDGRIMEIQNYNSEKPVVKEYGTHLTSTENVNGVCYDKKNRRLLVSIRRTEDANQLYKDIYSFDLVSKRMPVKPVLRIDLTDTAFGNLSAKNVQTVFQPSDLHIHPGNGMLYIIDGTRTQILRMKLSGDIRDLTELDKEKIIQPEGITFTPSGELFIASKGLKDEPGMLFSVRL